MSRHDIARDYFDALKELMEREGTNWVRPWADSGSQRNIITKNSYRGSNQFYLSLKGHASPFWGTYAQMQSLGAQVRKGEKSTHIMFFKPLELTNEQTDETRTVRILKSYSVFSLDQCDHKLDLWEEPRSIPDRLADIDDILAMTGARVSETGSRAYYQPSTDTIHVPPMAAFGSAAAYYGVRAHETIHWSGAPQRLDRKFGKRFGDQDYIFEEFVAEAAAGLFCSLTGISPEPRQENAQYINHWLLHFDRDPRLLLTAFSLAQKAADFIMPPPNPEPDPSRPAPAAQSGAQAEARPV